MNEAPKIVYRCSRRGERLRPRHASTIEFLHSDEQHWQFDLLDISSSGLSFGLEKGHPALEVGSRVDHVVVRVEGRSIEGALLIVRVAEEFYGGTVCGAEFQPAAESDRRELTEVIAALQMPPRSLSDTEWVE